MLFRVIYTICLFVVVLECTLFSFYNFGYSVGSIWLIGMSVISFFVPVLYIIRYAIQLSNYDGH